MTKDSQSDEIIALNIQRVNFLFARLIVIFNYNLMYDVDI